MATLLERTFSPAIKEAEGLLQHAPVEVRGSDLKIAYRVMGKKPRTIYEFEGALYSRHKEQSLVGPPAIAAIAFARQEVPTGRVALRHNDNWLVRVTEPYWRVTANPPHRGQASIRIEPRFSLVGTPLGSECFPLHQLDQAINFAQSASIIGGIPLDSSSYAQLNVIESFLASR